MAFALVESVEEGEGARKPSNVGRGSQARYCGMDERYSIILDRNGSPHPERPDCSGWLYL